METFDGGYSETMKFLEVILSLSPEPRIFKYKDYLQLNFKRNV
jgi:hypothetical protein